MGYNSRIYIVEKHNTPWEDRKRFAELIAKYELRGYPPLADFMRSLPRTDCHFYDGKDILVDSYGEPLTEAPLEKVIDVLEKEVERGESYRRVFPLLEMLKVFEEQRKRGEWGEMVVVHYGD